MIQRIQSIFLLIAVVCSVLALTTTVVSYDFSADRSFGLSILHLGHPALKAVMKIGGVYIIAAVGLSGIGSLTAVFLFKKRALQAKIAMFSFILSLLTFVFLIINFSIGVPETLSKMINHGIGFYLPIVAAVCNYLAVRFIKKDEELVRSADRMR